MTTFRTARNDDVPALADLWNRGTPDSGVARPLKPRELGDAAFSHQYFDLRGLVLAVEEGRPVGFAHSGVGPAEPAGPSHRPDPTLGTVAMMVVDPDADADRIGPALVGHAARSLRGRGAEVLYAGGQYPLNPFYWGIYGGSEFSGILRGHEAFHRAVLEEGFREVSRSVLMELGLVGVSDPPFDPRSLLLRRRFRVVIEPDCSFDRWWDAMALGATFATAFRLEDAHGRPIARATTWDMSGFERLDGRLRVGLVDVDVSLEHRRQGLGRHLIREVIRHHVSRGIHALCVQTRSENEPARELYRGLGFRQVDEAVLYRLDPA
ncbi:GNAT family N-acetyltransferase [Tautonia plasticadhaerens]|uniref:Putative acetyltransferase n=1 Tax=Tautonia plasticadhaerens TaxID=2527974 RepID=A0A518H031_9BACT|nr:GNAT family N-acetyltransferase [Tautonia plasticadhaerens]QDV34191.1 putative acetyltransferase [Tautonia plasticadhaerens]